MVRRQTGFWFFVAVAAALAACSTEKSAPFAPDGDAVGQPDAVSGADAILAEDVSAPPEGVAEDVSAPPTPAAFAQPEGVAVVGDYAFVANANYRFDGASIVFDPGFVTVVRLSDFQVVRQIPTAHKNPQVVVGLEDRALVLCSGETVWDNDAGVIRPVSDGSVEVIPVNEAETASAPALVIPLPAGPAGTLIGYPSSLAVTPDKRFAYAGSGTTAVLFKIDLSSNQVVRGAGNPISLGDPTVQDTLAVEAGPPGLLFAGSFNRDLVFALDTSSDAPASAPFQQVDAGKTQDMDGVLDLAYRAGGTPDLFVLLGLANAVQSLTTVQGAASLQTLGSTGLYPNRIAVWDAEGVVLVLNSGDNNLRALKIATGQSLDIVAFAPNTNPYDMALARRSDKDMLYVTGLLSNALYEVDLAAQKVVRQVPKP